jgi:Ca2+-binding RTX toxin-like protein
VKSTVAGTTTTLNGASSFTDDFSVGNNGHSLDDIQGPLTINGQGGNDRLVLDDQEDGNANSYTIRSGSVSRAGVALITYSLPGSVTSGAGLAIAAGKFDDTVVVKGTAVDTPVGLDLGAGNNTVTLGGGPFVRLNGILAPVTVVGDLGANAIVLDDVDSGAVPIAGTDYTVTATDVTRDGRQILQYVPGDGTTYSLTLDAGSGNDTIRLMPPDGGTSVLVNAGFGDDTIKIIPFIPVEPPGTLTVDGQGGSDTLDYSESDSGVRVNLALGTATGVAGGVSGIENVTGSPGDDILVGNDEANVLGGGPGSDILIGRGGADVIIGGLGDDILIGCSTEHDLDSAALEDIMAEWEFGGIDPPATDQQQYDARVAHLLGILAGGENGSIFLNRRTVTDDGVADRLEGDQGRDWFFKFGADTIVDLSPLERVN